MAALKDAAIVDVIDVEPRHLAMVRSVLARYVPFREVWAYGSRVKWNAADERSDLDVVVFGASEDEIYATREAFAESDIPFEVQVFDWENLPEDFQKNIKKKYYVLRTTDDWAEYSLGDIAKIKGGKRLPLGKNLTELKTQHPYIRTRDIKNNKIAVEELLFVPDEVFPEISNYIVDAGDIIISIVGTIGSIAIIPNSLHLANLTENCAKITNFETGRIDKNFLFYFFISPAGQDNILSRNVGSTQPKLPLYNIRDIPVLAPILGEQKAIAEVLGGLDDKIDLLHHQNKTLEAMAETLFRQWFVVDAKEEWEDGVLGDIIELHYGKGLKDTVRTGTGYPVIGSSGIVGYHNEFLVEAPGIVIGRKGTLGETIYLTDNFYPIDTTYYVKPKREIGYLFIYFLLRSIGFREMNSDSAVPGLNRDLALSIEQKIPPYAIINEFEMIAQPLFQKLTANNNQIRTLEKLRDNLLPKLMSGDVRVQL